MTAMTRFEDNLWREVQRAYGSELSRAAGPLQRRSRSRARAIAGTGLGVAGAGAATAIVLSAASSSPAFAVTPHRDGSVSVVIRRIDGIAGANQRLAQLGIHARAVAVADGCAGSAAAALPPVAVATLVRVPHANWISNATGTVRATIRPTQIPSGHTLVIPAVRMGALVRLARGRAVSGAVPTCLHPSIWIRAGSGPARITVFACRPGIVVRPGPTAPPQATGTSTSEAVAPSTGTTAGPTARTQSGTATGTATTSDSGTAPPNQTLAPRFLRACLLAARGSVTAR